MAILISNTYRPVLDEVAERTGVGAVQFGEKRTGNHRQIYYWRCNADAAVSVLQQLRPHLRIKAPMADLALDFQEKLHTPALKSDRTWQESYRLQMKAMNRRGPSTEPIPTSTPDILPDLVKELA